jgi:hypothetical protein
MRAAVMSPASATAAVVLVALALLVAAAALLALILRRTVPSHGRRFLCTFLVLPPPAGGTATNFATRRTFPRGEVHDVGHVLPIEFLEAMTAEFLAATLVLLVEVGSAVRQRAEVATGLALHKEHTQHDTQTNNRRAEHDVSDTRKGRLLHSKTLLLFGTLQCVRLFCAPDGTMILPCSSSFRPFR